MSPLSRTLLAQTWRPASRAGSRSALCGPSRDATRRLAAPRASGARAGRDVRARLARARAAAKSDGGAKAPWLAAGADLLRQCGMVRGLLFEDGCELDKLRLQVSATTAAVDAKGRFLVLGSALSTLVRVAELPVSFSDESNCTRPVMRTVRAPGTVNQVAVASRLCVVGAACSSGEVALWAACCDRLERKSVLRRRSLDRATGVAVSKNGKVVAAAFSKSTALGPGEIVLYDSEELSAPVQMRVFREDKAPLGRVCLSADARVVAFTAGFGQGARVCFSGVLKGSGDVSTFDVPSALMPAVALAPDARTLVAVGIFDKCTEVRILRSSAEIDSLTFRDDDTRRACLGGLPFAAAGNGGDFAAGGLCGYVLFRAQSRHVFEMNEQTIADTDPSDRFNMVDGAVIREDANASTFVGCCRDGYVRFWRFKNCSN